MRLFPKQRPVEAKLSPGSKVRIQSIRKTFEKSAKPKWTLEVFRVKYVKNTIPPVYVLEDESGEEVLGSFYEQELNEVSEPVSKVEYVGRHKNIRGKRYALVKLSSEGKEKWISVKKLNLIRKM